MFYPIVSVLIVHAAHSLCADPALVSVRRHTSLSRRLAALRIDAHDGRPQPGSASWLPVGKMLAYDIMFASTARARQYNAVLMVFFTE